MPGGRLARMGEGGGGTANSGQSEEDHEEIGIQRAGAV